jgi:signal transduction histidine kinase
LQETIRRTPAESAWALSRWTAAAYLCIGLALVCVLGMAIWGVLHDLRLVRSTLLQSEMGRIRSHAVRTVSIIQDKLRQQGPEGDIDSLRDSEFLRSHWNNSVRTDESRLYAAIVDNAGMVVVHSNPGFAGRMLGPVWYDQVVDELGDDVVDTTNKALTDGARALDVRVPIFDGDREVGSYHSGMNYGWLEREAADRQAETKRVWGWILMVMTAVVLAAGVSLYHITRRLTVFGEAMKLARVRRFAEIGQLMTGIVHEIRNPLNAMRLNLHVLERFAEQAAESAGETPMGEPGLAETQTLIRETNREIERVEGLMRILLGYARPDQPHNEYIDVRQELKATLDFLQPTLERGEIHVKAQFSDAPATIHMDRDRFRQVVFNLVNNAREAAGPGGEIRLNVARRPGVVEMTVADNGPGVASADRERIFEPFFSTKELGTGLGLPLVRRFVEEVGGSVVCEDNQPCGARFRVHFAEAETGGIENASSLASRT